MRFRQADRQAYSGAVPRVRKKTGYHHGALRETLLDAAVTLIATQGLEQVSLRELARAAGVSPGAPYHHFLDRAALFAAVAERGFRMLGLRLRDAASQASSPAQALQTLLESYVRFAAEEQPYFRLMFRPELRKGKARTSVDLVQAAGDEAFEVLIDVVRRCQETGNVAPADVRAITLLAWALGHGLATLLLDGPLARRSRLMGDPQEKLVAEATETFVRLSVGGPKKR